MARTSGSHGGTMVYWDVQTVPPPPNFAFLDNLLASHRTLGSGLFSLRQPLKLRAHGTEALPAAAHDYIVKNKIWLQQSISCGSEQGSSMKAMIVDMLLWATDQAHAPGMADMVVISRVLDPSLADAIHQLHIRNYKIAVATSFPPKVLTPLRECIPPQIKTLHQLFSHSPVNNAKVVAVEGKMVKNEMVDVEAMVRTRDCSPSGENPMSAVGSLLMENCRTLVEEYLREGVTEFLEYDLYGRFRARFMGKLNFKKVGFEKLDEFLQVAVPGVNFKAILVGSRPWILCNGPGLDYGARYSRMISDARPATPPQPVPSGAPLAMEEVRNWLEELVSSGRANAGMNLSQLGKDFEELRGKKLNFKSLHCRNLLELVSKFENLVHLERKDSMVVLFPRDTRRAKATDPENARFQQRPTTTPQKSEVPPRPPLSSFPRIVQSPGAQTGVARNARTPMPVPKFLAMPPIPTTVKAPASTEAVARVPSFPALVKQEVDTAPTPTTVRAASTEPVVNVPCFPAAVKQEVDVSPVASGQARAGNHQHHFPNPDAAGRTGEVVRERDRQFPLPKLQEKRALTVGDILAGRKPGSTAGALKRTSTLPPPPSPDLTKDTSPASVTRVEPGGGQHSLPNANRNAPGVGNGGHPARNGQDPRMFPDPGNGNKFDFYRFTSSPEEREAIKRTFDSVNRRLREEFKKRKLERAGDDDPTNNPP